MNATRFLATILILLPVAVCPDQEFKDPATCPFPLDVRRIVTDPASGKVGLLDWATVEAGKAYVWDCNVCDQEGDRIVLSVPDPAYTLTEGTPTADGYHPFSISFTPRPGVNYCTIFATDWPVREGADPNVRRVTVAFYGKTKNVAPVFGCGSIRR